MPEQPLETGYNQGSGPASRQRPGPWSTLVQRAPMTDSTTVVYRSHKIALDPTNKQVTYFKKACGTTRFAWNWALAEWQRQHEAGENPNEMALRKQLNAVKREQFPWMLEVAVRAPLEAIRHLGDAYSRFFRGLGKHPRPKKKGVRDSFVAEADHTEVRLSSSRIRIPRLGWVRMRESVRFEGRVKSVVVSREADRWFVSLLVEVSHETPKRDTNRVVGVDLGVTALAALSDGEKIAGPKAHKAALNRLRRTNKSLARKQKGSANRRKAKAKLARIHARIANIRRDSLHKLTTRLICQFDVIGIEDLNVKGMTKNHRLARSISDMGFYEFRRQLEYKAQLYGAKVVVIDRFAPTSKTCSDCGHRLEKLPLSVREWTCPACGSVHDRDVNAAKNIANLAARSAVSACGEAGSGPRRKPRAKPASMKQEPATGPARIGAGDR